MCYQFYLIRKVNMSTLARKNLVLEVHGLFSAAVLILKYSVMPKRVACKYLIYDKEVSV